MAVLLCAVTSYFILTLLGCHFLVLLKKMLLPFFVCWAVTCGFITVFLIVTGCFIKVFWAVTNYFVHAPLGCTFLFYSRCLGLFLADEFEPFLAVIY